MSSEINSFRFIFPPSHASASHQLAETLAPALAASQYQFGPFVEQMLALAVGCPPASCRAVPSLATATPQNPSAPGGFRAGLSLHSGISGHQGAALGDGFWHF